MNLEIKQPEPGTELPVVVHEWSDGSASYRAMYLGSGGGVVQYNTGNGWVCPHVDASISIFALLGLPLSIKVKAVVE